MIPGDQIDFPSWDHVNQVLSIPHKSHILIKFFKYITLIFRIFEYLDGLGENILGKKYIFCPAVIHFTISEQEH
jgi:hypothetical protein